MTKEKCRYALIEEYSGLFDAKTTIAYCSGLQEIVFLIDKLEHFCDINPCYSYDFKKIATDIDDALDYIILPGDKEVVADCKTYSEYLKLRAEGKI